MRVRIEYLDQNESFAQHLPVTGRLARQLAAADGQRWWVVTLDYPLEYQRHVAEPLQFELVRSSEVVIGNRWQGREIGGSEPTSVHILVPLSATATQAGTLRPDAFHAVAWGMCYAEAAA